MEMQTLKKMNSKTKLLKPAAKNNGIEEQQYQRSTLNATTGADDGNEGVVEKSERSIHYQAIYRPELADAPTSGRHLFHSCETVCRAGGTVFSR